MKIDKDSPSHIIAEDGMVFQRIRDDSIFGPEVWLGYTHYINGELLEEPLLELPEHFREIEAPKEFKQLMQ